MLSALRRPVVSSFRGVRLRSAQALEAPYVEEQYTELNPVDGEVPPSVIDTFPAPSHGRLATAEQYVKSLRGRDLDVWMFGEKVDEFVDHPIIKPSVNARHPAVRSTSRGAARVIPPIP